MNIESEFFHTFNIQTNVSLGYLGITDENLISLIGILNRMTLYDPCCLVYGTTRQEILEDILFKCMRNEDIIREQVIEVFSLGYRPEEVAFGSNG